MAEPTGGVSQLILDVLGYLLPWMSIAAGRAGSWAPAVEADSAQIPDLRFVTRHIDDDVRGTPASVDKYLATRANTHDRSVGNRIFVGINVDRARRRQPWPWPVRIHRQPAIGL
jgi:hypothetical protein